MRQETIIYLGTQKAQEPLIVDFILVLVLVAVLVLES